MKTPEEIFDEAIKAKALDIVFVKDAELYEAGLDAIKKALTLGADKPVCDCEVKGGYEEGVEHYLQKHNNL